MSRITRVTHVFVNGEKVPIRSFDVDKNIERNFRPISPEEPKKGVEERIIETEGTIYTNGETDFDHIVKDGVRVEVPGEEMYYDFDYMQRREATYSFEPGRLQEIEEELVLYKRRVETKEVRREEVLGY